jgi:hypothetical protein
VLMVKPLRWVSMIWGMGRVYHSLFAHGIIGGQSKEIMLKPIRWNTFLRDFIRIQIGFILFGLAITLMIRGNIGTSAWVVLEAALAERLGITVGTMTVIMGFLVLTSAVAMREKLGWGTLANILSIGPWVDLWNLVHAFGGG